MNTNEITKNVWKGVLIVVCIVGGIGPFTFLKGCFDTKEEIPQPIPNPAIDVDNATTHTDAEQTYEPENTVVEPEPKPEPEPEPQEIWWDCNICGATGRCQLCIGSGICGVCGGGGQVFSVFYGDEVGPARMTDCGNCNGTGRCPSCEGSGLCFACKGTGRCKQEE